MNNRIYDGAMLHGTNKQNIASGELGDITSLDLGLIPEDTIDKIRPLIDQINNILSEHKVYFWLTTGYHEENNTVE